MKLTKKVIPGYNAPRATREEYDRFEKAFLEELRKANIDGLSLMLYGSYPRGDYVPGRSDIDGVLTFKGGVQINKDDLLKCSRALSNSIKESNIPLQIGVTDQVTLEDGRFNSYEEDFEDYFLEEGKVVLGPNYIPTTRYPQARPAIASRATSNLRKSREGIFHSEMDRTKDPEKLRKNFGKGLNGAINITKQIAYLTDNKLRKQKFSSLEFIASTYPEVDLSPMEAIREVYTNPALLDRLYRDEDRLMELWLRSLDSFEQLVHAYMKKVPVVDRWFEK